MEKKFNWGKRIAFALAFVTVGSIAMIAGGQYAAKRKRDEQPQVAIENTIITPQQSNGIKLMSATIDPEDYEEYGVAATAESAMTLTATITPANATNKKVDWSVAWVESFGDTVTDFVRVTPTSDGALTATVSCLVPFIRQIKITVTSRADSTKTASCTVDYAKRIVDNDMHLYKSVSETNYIYQSEESVTLDNNLSAYIGLMITGDFEYSTGTVNDEITNIEAKVLVNAANLSFINDAIGETFAVATAYLTGYSVPVGVEDPSVRYSDLIIKNGVSISEDNASLARLETYLKENQVGAMYLFDLQLNITYKYGGSFNKTYKLYFNNDQLTVAVQSVAVSDSGITF